MLRRCTLLVAAKRYPQVVCQVHLGIVRGAMDIFGGSAERTAIMPFAEPGACRLQLQTRSRPGRQFGGIRAGRGGWTARVYVRFATVNKTTASSSASRS